MQPSMSFIHARHDDVEPPADDDGGGRARTALLAHLPRSSPEVMESIALALLSMTVPGLCLRAGTGGPPEPWGAPEPWEAAGEVTE